MDFWVVLVGMDNGGKKTESYSWGSFWSRVFFISAARHHHFVSLSFHFYKKKEKIQIDGVFLVVIAGRDDGRKMKDLRLPFAY